MIVSGPSGCGKTTFLKNLLVNRDWLLDIPIKNIIWCYAEISSLPKIDDAEINYVKGLPEYIENVKNEPTLIVLDDLMNDSDNSKISELFTKGSHHRNISVILITQNIFHKGTHSRDISLNTKYFSIFKNPRDQQQFQFMARQIYPENSKELVRIYKTVTSTPHNYLLIDLTQDINENLRFRSNIFNKLYCEVYCKLESVKNEFKTETLKGQPAFSTYSERLQTKIEKSNF